MRKPKLLLLTASFVLLAGCTVTNDTETKSETQSSEIITEAQTDAVETEAQTEEQPETVAETQPETEAISMGKINALGKAKEYLFVMAFSHSGLVEQLKFEGFTDEEAAYGADNCGADWNEQASKKAKEYLDVMSFSRQGLIDQLLFDGFSQEQAEFGVTAVGY